MATRGHCLSEGQNVVARFRSTARGGSADAVLLDGLHLIAEALDAGIRLRVVAVAVEALSQPEFRTIVERLQRAGVEIVSLRSQIMDALPIPTWLPYAQKLLALGLCQVLLMGVVLITGVGIQLAHGYLHVEPGLWALELFGVRLFRLFRIDHGGQKVLELGKLFLEHLGSLPPRQAGREHFVRIGRDAEMAGCIPPGENDQEHACKDHGESVTPAKIDRADEQSLKCH